MPANPLIGTWRLTTLETRGTDGEVAYPYGSAPQGYLTYNDDGYMFFSIRSADRQPFADSNPFGGSPEERAEAALTYVGYCGTYEYQGDSVIQRPLVSSFPNWVGTDQFRFVHLRGHMLELHTRPMVFAGREQVIVTSWERVGA